MSILDDVNAMLEMTWSAPLSPPEYTMPLAYVRAGGVLREYVGPKTREKIDTIPEKDVGRMHITFEEGFTNE